MGLKLAAAVEEASTPGWTPEAVIALVAVVVGALGTWGAVWWTTREARRARVQDLRFQAYVITLQAIWEVRDQSQSRADHPGDRSVADVDLERNREVEARLGLVGSPEVRKLFHVLKLSLGRFWVDEDVAARAQQRLNRATAAADIGPITDGKVAELQAATRAAEEKKAALAGPMAEVWESVDNLRDQMIKEVQEGS